MNEFRNIHILVEGATEEAFVREVLAPYCMHRGVLVQQSLLSKKGQKGGDIKFSRIKNEVRNFLLQRTDLIVCTFIDYYGVKEWPGTDKISSNATPTQIAHCMNSEAIAEMQKSFPGLAHSINTRYIPFTAVHEFETLLFSDTDILAREIGIDAQIVNNVLIQFGEAEKINNSPETAPSKRILSWNPDYSKVRKGLAIARQIGIEKMRFACPLFDAWLKKLGI